MGDQPEQPQGPSPRSTDRSDPRILHSHHLARAFVELGERLYDHLQLGQPMGTFPGLKPAGSDGCPTAVTPTDSMAIVKAPGGDLAVLVAAIREAASAPLRIPLLRARGLAEWSSPPPIWGPSWVRERRPGAADMKAYGHRFERHH